MKNVEQQIRKREKGARNKSRQLSGKEKGMGGWASKQ
jgi:hypothetical protein